MSADSQTGRQTNGCSLFSLPCSLQLSALTDLLFDQLWTTGAFMNAEAVSHGDLWFESRHCLCQVFCISSFLLPVNVSLLLPLSCSVNFQKTSLNLTPPSSDRTMSKVRSQFILARLHKLSLQPQT